MNKTFIHGIAVAIALSFAGTASAGVIYNWHQLSSSSTISASSGRIEITDAAYQSEHLEVTYDDQTGDFNYPDGPLISFTFGNDTTSAVDISRDSYMQHAEMSLLFANGGLMTGNLFANDNDSDVHMSSAGSVWTIDQFNSDDAATGCFEAPGCSGATGEWVLDASSVAVPEPGTPVLFGLGLVGIAIAARKRKRAAAEAAKPQ